MSVVSDFLAGAKSIDSTVPRTPLTRLAVQQLQGLNPFDYPAGTTSTNGVQVVTHFNAEVDGGTYTLTVTFEDGTTFTTGDIAYDAIASAITTAIDTAATSAVVPGWTNGDIVVTGGPLSTTNVTLTFSGASVAAKRFLVTSLSGDNLTVASAPAVVVTDFTVLATITINGQPARYGWAILIALGIVTPASMPLLGTAPTVTATLKRGHFPLQLRDETISSIVEEIAIAEGNDAARVALLTAFGF
jgi:hypothetical protein